MSNKRSSTAPPQQPAAADLAREAFESGMTDAAVQLFAKREWIAIGLSGGKALEPVEPFVRQFTDGPLTDVVVIVCRRNIVRSPERPKTVSRREDVIDPRD